MTADMRILTPADLNGVDWYKSSYSDIGNNCVEVAHGFPGIVPVRDSKVPAGPALVFQAGGWSSFVGAVKAGRLSG